VTLKLDLTDGKTEVAMTGGKVLLTLLHMMRLGGTEIADCVRDRPHDPRRLCAADLLPTDLEESEGGLADDGPPEMGGLYNAVECRENSQLVTAEAAPAQHRGQRHLRAGGQLNTAPDTCAVWGVSPRPWRSAIRCAARFRP